MAKIITSETMKCTVCSNNKWEIKKNLSGVGIAIILFGWILAIPTCSSLMNSGIGPGFFGMDGAGPISFLVIVIIAHIAANSYKKRKYKCTECGHVTSGE